MFPIPVIFYPMLPSFWGWHMLSLLPVACAFEALRKVEEERCPVDEREVTVSPYKQRLQVVQ